MGFASTASFFEDQAKKARDQDRKRHLLEVAAFYRQLAGIAPGFPDGFSPNGRNGHATRWAARAEECRTMADHFHDKRCREQLQRLAVTYDQMAQAAE
jgi:hypothetical protein